MTRPIILEVLRVEGKEVHLAFGRMPSRKREGAYMVLIAREGSRVALITEDGVVSKILELRK